MATKALQKWALVVLKRDNHTCQKCGSTKKVLAHHIKPKSVYPNLSLQVKNGTTLCYKCHKQVPIQTKLFEYCPWERFNGFWRFPVHVWNLANPVKVLATQNKEDSELAKAKLSEAPISEKEEAINGKA